jgi:predicted dienelactone hydrolase
MGGFSVLSASGLRASKQRFVDYCTANAGKLDCGWYQDAGLDLATLDQPAFEASNLDPRVLATVAVDPALSQAFDPASAQMITTPTLILNLGTKEEIPAAMNAAALAHLIPRASYAEIPGASHFSFMDQCRLMGRIVLGLASADALCADSANRTPLHAKIGPQIIDFLTKNLKS